MREAAFKQLVVLPLFLISACEIRNREVSAPVVSEVIADASVQENGILDVRERIRLRVPADTAAIFTRVIEGSRADSLTFVSAELDTSMPDSALERLAPTSDEIETSEGETLVLTVRFAPSAQQERVLAWRYHARGSVHVVGLRGRLDWALLSGTQGFEIPKAIWRLTLPPDSQFIGRPSVTSSGWEVQPDRGAFAGERLAVGGRERAHVTAEFTIQPGTIAEPAWQIREQLAAELVPAFISAGLFFLAIGAGIVWIVRLQHPRRGPHDTVASTARAVEVHRDRHAAARGLWQGAVVCGLSALALAVLIETTLRDFGVWAHAIPVSIALVGAMLLLLSRRL